MKLKQLCLALSIALAGSAMAQAPSQGKCRLVAQQCVDGPSTKVINGVAVWQPCWNYSNTFTCLDPNVADYCNPLKRTDCEVQGQECLERATSGECMRYEHKYSCDVDIKKGHGGMLPPGITEEAPTHLITQEWDTAECDAKKANFGKCTVVGETCLEGPATKEINGVAVTRDCWKKELQYQCNEKDPVNQCEELEQKGCRLKEQRCLSQFPDGSCQVYDRVYTCTVSEEHEEIVSKCQDRDFAKAMTNMEVAREIGRYFDMESQTFFKGDPSFCTVKLGGALDGLLGGDCCQPQGDPGDFKDYAVQAGTQMALEYGVGSLGSAYTYSVLSFNAPEFITSSISAAEGFASSFSAGASGGPPLSFMGFGVSSTSSGLVVTFDPMSFAIAIAIMALQQWLACEQTDTVTVFRREADLCHRVGSYCSTDTPLGCVEKKEAYCCYISKLAKIVNVQGKQQLGRDFGSPKDPDCSGFMAQDLELLDFSRMDLSEFFDEIRSRMPDTATMMDRVNRTAQEKAQQAQDNYYAQ